MAEKDDDKPKPRTPPTLICARADPGIPFELPEAFYDGDAGVDLFVPEYVMIHRGCRALVRTNLVMQFAPGTIGLVVGRGSAFHQHGIQVVPGIIDPGFRGEVKILVYAAGPKAAVIRPGDRIAQLVLLPHVPIVRIAQAKTVEAIAVEEGQRGVRAWGSTNAMVKDRMQEDS